MDELRFRKATPGDLEFVVTGILAAERSGGDITLYETLFDLDSAGVESTVRGALAEEIEGSELFRENFLLAVVDGAPAGCIATWIEADESLPSSLVKASILSHVLGATRWKAAQPRLKAMSATDIARDKGAIQIESVYVAEEHRGRRLTGELIAHALESWRATRPETTKAQILSLVKNERSAKAFEHAGFTAVRRTHSDPASEWPFPGGGRVLWEKRL